MAHVQTQSATTAVKKWTEIIEDLWKHLPHFQDEEELYDDNCLKFDCVNLQFGDGEESDSDSETWLHHNTSDMEESLVEVDETKRKMSQDDRKLFLNKTHLLCQCIYTQLLNQTIYNNLVSPKQSDVCQALALSNVFSGFILSVLNEAYTYSPSSKLGMCSLCLAYSLTSYIVFYICFIYGTLCPVLQKLEENPDLKKALLQTLATTATSTASVSPLSGPAASVSPSLVVLPSQGAMNMTHEQLCDWLKEKKIAGKYLQLFEEDESIDGGELATYTEQDLEELGISESRIRKKILHHFRQIK